MTEELFQNLIEIEDTTAVIVEVAPRLGMTPEQLLRAIIEHRRQLKKRSRDFSL
jgi:transposase-like protein